MLGTLNKIKSRLRNHPSWLQSALLSAVFLAAVVLVWPHPAYAIWDAVMKGIATILLFFAELIGKLALLLIGLLVEVAQFNNFINAPAVKRGWVIVRDVCNMFFIVILLLIAFGSVFRIEEYQYKRTLSKLLVMAVLVNFSKSITGFFIDIAQVVMLTFVNGFKEAAAGNFVNGFHLAEMFQFAEQGPTGEFSEAGSSASIFLGSAALALITILISTIVVAVYLVVFLLRIIALWFLTIISPIAYLLSAFPGDARKYSTQWWDYFGKYATTGPILAFFLWLSLAVMQFGSDASSYGFNVSSGEYKIPAAAATKIGEADVLLSFVINIMLLMGGLWMTQQLGVAGGKLAGTAFNKIQNAGAAIGKGAFRAATYLPREYGKRIGYGAADLGLAAAARIPLVGTTAAVARAKLRQKREYQEDKEKRYLEYMPDSDRERIIRSKMRFPGIFQTEKGRAIMKSVTEYQMQTGQPVTSSRAKRLLRNGAAINDPRVVNANMAFNTKFIQRARRNTGHSINIDNEDIYRDKKGGEVIEKFIKKNPHAISDNYRRIVSIGRSKGTDLGSQRAFTTERLSNNDIADLSYGAFLNPQFMNQLLNTIMQRMNAKMANRNAIVASLNASGIRNVPGLMTGGVATPLRPDFFRQIWAGIHGAQNKSTRNNNAIDSQIQAYIAGLVPPYQQYAAQGAYSYRLGGADIDKKKFKKTRELIESHSKANNITPAEATISFEESKEYKTSPDQYYSRQEYIDAQTAMVDGKFTAQENVDLDQVSGIRGSIRKSKKAQESGEPLGETRVAADLEKFGIEGRGIALRGQAKDDFLAKLLSYLKEQKQYTEEEINDFQKAVQQADQLTVLNKGRTLGDARHLMAHERAHAVGDSHPEAVQQLWETVPEEEKEVIRQQVRKFENDPNLSEESIAHEYWAEGIANETRWQDTTSNIKLNDKGKEFIKKFSQAEKDEDASEKLIFSDKFTNAPNGLTRPDTPILPTSLLQAMAKNDPNVKPNDQILINALEHLSNKLNAVSSSFKMLSVLSDLPDNLSKALKAYGEKTNQSSEEIINRLKLNDNNLSEINNELVRILSNYRPQITPTSVNQSA